MTEEANTFLGKWLSVYHEEALSAHRLKEIYSDYWVRFHTLDDAKRYADSQEEAEEILRRHHEALTFLSPGKIIYLITCDWSDQPEDHINSTPRMYVTSVGDEFSEVPTKVFMSEIKLNDKILDAVLSRVANDDLSGVIIAPLDLSWLYHPYDGGADIIVNDLDQKQVLLKKFEAWLP